MATANDLLARAIDIYILMKFFLYEIYLKAMSGIESQEVTDCYWELCS